MTPGHLLMLQQLLLLLLSQRCRTAPRCQT